MHLVMHCCSSARIAPLAVLARFVMGWRVRRVSDEVILQGLPQFCQLDLGRASSTNQDILDSNRFE